MRDLDNRGASNGALVCCGLRVHSIFPCREPPGGASLRQLAAAMQALEIDFSRSQKSVYSFADIGKRGAWEMELSDEELPAPPARRRGRPRGSGRGFQLPRLNLYPSTYEQLHVLARANGRSLAKELQARVEGEVVLDWFSRHRPEESRAECDRLIEMVGNERVDRAAAKEAVTRFIGSPLGRVIEIAGARILEPEVIQGLAEALGCSRWQAALWWFELTKMVLPYVHTTIATELAAETGEADGGRV